MPAYNQYFPQNYSYSPYYPQYQPAYQPPVMQQPVQQQVQTQAPIQSGIIWVATEAEATMYPVAPNNAVTLWNQNEPVVYLKQADASGKPTMKTYDLVERIQSASNATNGSDGKTPAYATKDDLSAVVGVVRGFDEALGNIKSDIDTIKGDMYGIAGKKKSTKKQAEVGEDE